MKLKLKKALAIAGVFITLSPVLMDTGVLPSAVNKAYVLAETYYSYAPTDEDCKPVVTSLSDKKKDTSTSSKTSSSGASKSTSNTDFTEGALKWYHDHEGKVSYSQEVRDGPSSYDCSSSLYYALREAGATDNGYAVSTETEHKWLKDNGYDLIAEGRDTDKPSSKRETSSSGEKSVSLLVLVVILEYSWTMKQLFTVVNETRGLLKMNT